MRVGKKALKTGSGKVLHFKSEAGLRRYELYNKIRKAKEHKQ
jgi:hypothetical protein